VFPNGPTNTNLFAGTFGGGAFLSTNNGTSWTAVNTGLTSNVVKSLAVSDTNLFAGTLGGGVFLSTNKGTTWAAVNAGMTYTDINSVAVLNTNVYAGTLARGVWRRPLAEMITSVEMLSVDAPTDFSLSQNYPNPFNPATAIQFSLPSKSFVSLKVFDVTGRELAILVSEELPAGTYLQRWNAACLASGAYFYRLQAGSFNETKRLVLLR
jgi:hypothetical protein